MGQKGLSQKCKSESQTEAGKQRPPKVETGAMGGSGERKEARRG